ncbi:unnamed protein product [Brassica rapa]|uniref:Uncharacterized protein n=1 Tax=Brassica campestris TaxID=3711 RepID=A0A3P5YTK8_BRACM|nr:unnamed protein product [Brassica rapa]VDC71086.1 unnamed protein product [Brassica rapa]
MTKLLIRPFQVVKRSAEVTVLVTARSGESNFLFSIQ